MPVGVHDIFHEMGPFLPVHRQCVQIADVLVAPVCGHTLTRQMLTGQMLTTLFEIRTNAHMPRHFSTTGQGAGSDAVS